ncbi:MAG: Na+/H+ antiporter subunit G [Rhodobacteraceae bacterium]|nr:Na+/H+ antiporter subunit G [Paracoccaceae bacterium]
MNIFAEIAISFFIVLGGIFGLAGSFGLVKLTNTMQRLHAPTKATTLGVGGVLIGSMIYFWATDGVISFHELMITLFLFLTAPVTANFISKAYMLENVEADELPETGSDYGWGGYDDPPHADDDDEEPPL